jgi:hypothetical protein
MQADLDTTLPARPNTIKKIRFDLPANDIL